MAGISIASKLTKNNNAAGTDAFRTYIKDNYQTIKDSCTILSVRGSSTSRYKNNSHAMWIELGLDPRYSMIADYLNGIDGDTDLNLISSVYIPDTGMLDSISRRVNR